MHRIIVLLLMLLMMSVPGLSYLPHEESATSEQALNRFYSNLLKDRGIELNSQKLTGALKNQDDLVRAGAAFMLGKLKQRSAIPDLRPLLTDRQPRVRLVAAEVLLGFGNDSGFDTVLEETQNKQATMRMSAITLAAAYVSKWPAKGESALPIFLQALRDEEKMVRAAASVALGKVGGATAVPELKRALESESDPGVRLVMKEQLKKLGLP